ncbi:MAG: fliQ [Bacillota bacterium]|jgi:flagellar biosynthetic protein FliQ|nr:fliQ [Bacillota bacterium]
MDSSKIAEVMQAAMSAGMKVGAPILITSLLIGLIISVFQAATQIHEQTLTFVPKLIVTAILLVVLGPWMTEVMSDFIYYIFDVMLKIY